MRATWLWCKAEHVINIHSYENLANSGLNDTIKHYLIRKTTYVKINQQYIQKTDI